MHALEPDETAGLGQRLATLLLADQMRFVEETTGAAIPRELLNRAAAPAAGGPSLPPPAAPPPSHTSSFNVLRHEGDDEGPLAPSLSREGSGQTFKPLQLGAIRTRGGSKSPTSSPSLPSLPSLIRRVSLGGRTGALGLGGNGGGGGDGGTATPGPGVATAAVAGGRKRRVSGADMFALAGHMSTAGSGVSPGDAVRSPLAAELDAPTQELVRAIKAGAALERVAEGRVPSGVDTASASATASATASAPPSRAQREGLLGLGMEACEGPTPLDSGTVALAEREVSRMADPEVSGAVETEAEAEGEAMQLQDAPLALQMAEAALPSEDKGLGGVINIGTLDLVAMIL